MKNLLAKIWVPLLLVSLAALQSFGIDAGRAIGFRKISDSLSVNRLSDSTHVDSIIVDSISADTVAIDSLPADTAVVLTARDTIVVPDSLKYTDPFFYKYYIAVKDSATRAQVRDSLIQAQDTLELMMLDSLYVKDSTEVATAKFNAWYNSLTKKERKKYDYEQALPGKIAELNRKMEVKAGDILVEGGVPIMNEDGTVKRYEFCVADADIQLQCIYSYEEKIEEAYVQKVYTGRKSENYFLMLGTKKLQLPQFWNKYEACDVIEEKKQLCLFGNYYLPVYTGRVLTREYTEEEKIYNKEEIKTIFEERIQKFIESLDEKGVQIIEKNVTINKTSHMWQMKVDFLAVEMTGRPKETHLEQVAVPKEIVGDKPAE